METKIPTDQRQEMEKEWIMSKLRKLNPDHSIMAHALHGGAQFNYNFGNLIQTIVSAWNDSHNGMVNVLPH